MKTFKKAGYDWNDVEQCWQMTTYGYRPKDIKHNMVKESEFLLKTGIAKEDGETASKQAHPTRGRFTRIEHLWGSKSDRFSFPKDIDKTQEKLISEIVLLIDNRFAKLYEKKTLRVRVGDEDAGGEEYMIVPKNGGVEKIQNDWIKLFNKTCKEKLGKEPYKKDSHPFTFKAQSQWRVLGNIKLAFSVPEFTKGIVYAIMGWGKSYLMFAITQFVDRFKNRPTIHIISPSISSGQQLQVDCEKLARKFNMKNREIYGVSSGERDDDMRHFGLHSYMVGESYLELRKKCYEELKTGKRVQIHFNIDSYYKYETKVWNPTIKRLNKEGIKFEYAAVIADEIDEYCGKRGEGKSWVFFSKMWDTFYGNTGTAKLAPNEKLRLSNEHAYCDSEHLGLKVIDEVTAKEATEEGAIAPVEFRFVGCVGPLKDSYSKNKYVNIRLPKSKVTIPAIGTNFLRSINIMLYSIKKDGHSHYVLGARTKEQLKALTMGFDKGGKMIEPIIELFKKEYDYLKGYEIHGILRTNDRRDKVKLVEQAKKAIMVTTKWFFRSQNCVSLTGMNSAYYMKNVNDNAQSWRVNRLDPNNPHKRAIVNIDMFNPHKAIAAIEAVEQYYNGITITTKGKISSAKRPKPTGGSNGNKNQLPANTISCDFGDDCPVTIREITKKMMTAMESGDFQQAKDIVKYEHPYSKYHPLNLKQKVDKVKTVLELYEKDLPTFKSVEYRGLQMEFYKGKSDWDMFGDTNESYIKCLKKNEITPNNKLWPIVIQRQRFLTINK